MVCLRNICINTLNKGDDDYDDNNNKYRTTLGGIIDAVTTTTTTTTTAAAAAYSENPAFRNQPTKILVFIAKFLFFDSDCTGRFQCSTLE